MTEGMIKDLARIASLQAEASYINTKVIAMIVANDDRKTRDEPIVYNEAEFRRLSAKLRGIATALSLISRGLS